MRKRFRLLAACVQNTKFLFIFFNKLKIKKEREKRENQFSRKLCHIYTSIRMVLQYKYSIFYLSPHIEKRVIPEATNTKGIYLKGSCREWPE